MNDRQKNRRPASGWEIENKFFTQQRMLVYGCAAVVAYAAGLAWLVIRPKGYSGSGLGPCNDFDWIWLSSRFALSHALDLAYNYSAFTAADVSVFGSPHCVLEHFDYPPTLLLFTYPFGFLPYPIAFAGWLIATLLVYLTAVYAVIPSLVAVIGALTIYPVLFNVLAGHNGFLTAGLLGLALVFSEGRPWLAGIFIGLLSYKPQFGILFPLALLFSRNWRAFLGAVVTSVLFAAGAAIAFGSKTWPAFFGALASRG
ncbi:MAG TPA: glycosyltransferase family 87 protein, partial [Stellaceae bacterium]|nr:glycosyltransferase family 87 protein [Stellaceae bacterium]